MASAWSVQLLSIAAGTLVACAGPRTSAPADVPAAASTPAPYRWASAPLHPIRVIPVDHGGEPQRCRTNHDEHPCDIEATANGQVFYRIWTPRAALIGPDLSLRWARTEPVLFSLEPDGTLLGPGLFQALDTPRVLVCHLTSGPTLRCKHEFEESPKRVWNSENCSASFVTGIDGGSITTTFPASSEVPPLVVARIEPAPPDDAAKALALFLYAMAVVENETRVHTTPDPE
jgi:hypothetical protein